MMPVVEYRADVGLACCAGGDGDVTSRARITCGVSRWPESWNVDVAEWSVRAVDVDVLATVIVALRGPPRSPRRPAGQFIHCVGRAQPKKEGTR